MWDFLDELLNNHQGFVIATFAGITSLLVALITSFAMRKKTSADVAKQLTDIAMSLIDPLQEEVDGLKKDQRKLEDEIMKLKAENEVLHRWSQVLFSQVVESGGDPVSFEQVQKWSDM